MASTVADHAVVAEATISAVSKSTVLHSAVRIEGEDNSIGRSYSCSAKGANIVRGLGVQRRALRSKTFDPYAEGKVQPTLESMTMMWTNLASGSREQYLAYFRNTWELTDVLFSVSCGLR